MKKNYLLVLAIFLAFASVGQAQFTPFKAKDGVSTADTKVKNSGFPSPELLSVGAITGQLPNIPINFFFDVSNGTANAWLYLFHSASNHDTLVAYVVTKLPVIGYQTLSFSPASIIDRLPFKPSTSLESKTWIDSDVMAQYLRNDHVYQNYMADHPDAVVKLVSVAVNTNDPLLDQGVTYWFLIVQGSTGVPMPCQIQGETGKVTCQSITAVADGQPASQEIRAYPTPATDILYVNIPSSVQSLNSELELRDAFGNRVKELVAPQNGEAEIVTISTSGLASGLYFVRYVNNSGAVTVPVIVNK